MRNRDATKNLNEVKRTYDAPESAKTNPEEEGGGRVPSEEEKR